MLGDYHAAMGRLIAEHEGTLDRFAGDGILVFFNDPIPIPEPGKRAATMALAMRARFGELRTRWQKTGYELDLGIGIARGYATLGAFGYEGRFDYTAVGRVVNLAARLCGEAKPGQILIDQRTRAALAMTFAVEAIGPSSSRVRPAGPGVRAHCVEPTCKVIDGGRSRPSCSEPVQRVPARVRKEGEIGVSAGRRHNRPTRGRDLPAAARSGTRFLELFRWPQPPR